MENTLLIVIYLLGFVEGFCGTDKTPAVRACQDNTATGTTVYLDSGGASNDLTATCQCVFSHNEIDSVKSLFISLSSKSFNGVEFEIGCSTHVDPFASQEKISLETGSQIIFRKNTNQATISAGVCQVLTAAFPLYNFTITCYSSNNDALSNPACTTTPFTTTSTITTTTTTTTPTTTTPSQTTTTTHSLTTITNTKFSSTTTTTQPTSQPTTKTTDATTVPPITTKQITTEASVTTTSKQKIPTPTTMGSYTTSTGVLVGVSITVAFVSGILVTVAFIVVCRLWRRNHSKTASDQEHDYYNEQTTEIPEAIDVTTNTNTRDTSLHVEHTGDANQYELMDQDNQDGVVSYVNVSASEGARELSVSNVYMDLDTDRKREHVYNSLQ